MTADPYVTAPSLDVLDVLRLGECSISNLVADTGRQDRAVRLVCDRLVRIGWAVQSGTGPVRYAITPAGLAVAKRRNPKKMARRKRARAKPTPDLLAYVRQGYRTVAEIAEATDRAHNTIGRCLMRLVRAGLLTATRSQSAGAEGQPPYLFRLALTTTPRSTP